MVFLLLCPEARGKSHESALEARGKFRERRGKSRESALEGTGKTYELALEERGNSWCGYETHRYPQLP